MSFDWEDFVTIAEYLEINPDCPEEAAQRSAVSRAYYAAYCIARNLAEASGKIELQGSADDHREVMDFYDSIPNLMQVATYLREMRRWRNDCDYENNNLQRLDKLCLSAKFNAHKVINLLKNFPQQTP
jgi:uncharacterized protein (UPF0332 family)